MYWNENCVKLALCYSGGFYKGHLQHVVWDLRISALDEADTQVVFTVSALCAEKVNPHSIFCMDC